MKKLFSSAISLFTSFSLLSGSSIVSAYAESYENVTAGIDLTEEEIIFGDFESLNLNLPQTAEILSNYKSGFHNFGDYLDANNYAVYEAFSALSTPSTDEIIVKLPETVSMTLATIPGTSTASDEDEETFRTAIFTNCKSGIDSVLLDMPEIFWLDESQLQIGIEDYTARSTYVQGEKKYKISINSLKFKPEYMAAYGSLEGVNEYKELLEQAVQNFPVEGETRYEQIKSIHDYICNFTVYDVNGEFYNSAIGSLVIPGVVCEGYAKGFKLVCDSLDIPCVLVFGNFNSETRVAHMWDYVQMEDGNWYAVDVTWDDLDGTYGRELKYDYLVKGSESFNALHTPETGYDGTLLTYPELSVYDYDPNAAAEITTTSTETTVTTLSVATTTVTATSEAEKTEYTETSAASTASDIYESTAAETTSTKTKPSSSSAETTEPTTTTTTETATSATTTNDTAATTESSETTIPATSATEQSSAAASTQTASSTTTTQTTSTTTKSQDIIIEPVYQKGDVNLDGMVNIADLVYCANAVKGTAEPIPECDVNEDGIVNVYDLVKMRKIFIKLTFT